MDKGDIEDFTIEQYLRLTQESQTPKKIEDMTIAEYLKYDKMMNMNYISNAKSYFPTYFGKSTPIHDPIREFSHYFSPNQLGIESDCDSKDMEEEVEYMTDDEIVMSEQVESNHGYTRNIQHFEEKDDVDECMNEMKDGIMKRQFEASIASVSGEVSFIASNKVDKDDKNTSDTASCQLPIELSPRSFLLPFDIDNHSFYAITTLDAKDNIMPLKVYEYLGLDKFKGTSTVENTIGTNEPLGTIDILVRYGQQKIDDTTREQRIGHNNLHESDREFIFNEWILDSYDVKEEYAREIGNPYSRIFDEYNRVFNNEIEHLSNEYILRIGKKGYVLDDLILKVTETFLVPNIFLAPDDSIPPGIKNDDYDSEGDVLFLEELLNDDSISLPEYESFHVDIYNVPSSPRPPEKPPDDDVYFDIEPNTGVLTTKVVDDIFDNSIRELYVYVPNVLPSLPPLYPVFDTLLPFLSENEDKVFNPGILISKEEKTPHLLSHRGFKVFQLINECPMMIYGEDIPILDVPFLHFYPS
ncbi:hypothetical protein Tco_0033633 [Tanacetum coccineum]